MNNVKCPSCDTKFEIEERLDDFETSTVCPDCEFRTSTWQFDLECKTEENPDG